MTLSSFDLKAGSMTLLALVAFAANSVLCRMALGAEAIDAASFTVLRLVSGAIALVLLVALRRRADSRSRGSWISAAALFLYAIAFSFAYVSLDAGTGALILFGAVQITMIGASLATGAKLHAVEWCGVAIAFAGLVYLNLPGATNPSPAGFVLMASAGIAWGIYTLKGRGSRDPLADTGSNFVRTLPFVVVLCAIVLWRSTPMLTPAGIALAITSGALASGVGYAVWYTALQSISATQAAVLQLSVPVIAAVGGILFLSEIVTLRLTVSAAMILGGIALVLAARVFVR